MQPLLPHVRMYMTASALNCRPYYLLYHMYMKAPTARTRNPYYLMYQCTWRRLLPAHAALSSCTNVHDGGYFENMPEHATLITSCTNVHVGGYYQHMRLLLPPVQMYMKVATLNRSPYYLQYDVPEGGYCQNTQPLLPHVLMYM